MAQDDEPSASPFVSNVPSVSEQSPPFEEVKPFEITSSVQSIPPSDFVRDVLNRVDARKERAATELGIGINEVESLPFDLSTLESEGIFMNIDCQGFGTLVRQLEWKTLGVKLPASALRRAEDVWSLVYPTRQHGSRGALTASPKSAPA
ncbi:MAG: hypothetical protein ACRD6X_18775 [Pyrinomonadaceae bacterium]